MALWSDSSRSDPSLDNGDIRTFAFSHESQPPDGPTIMVNYAPGYDYSVGNVGGVIIDWSRIVAVVVDEPYGPQPDPGLADPRIESVIQLPNHDPACSGDPTPYIAPIDAALQRRAMELKALAPKARFWVNFTDHEARWMAACKAPQVFIRTYMDVVSADWSPDGSGDNIASAEPFLSVVAANRSNPGANPGQQLALIPGVFSAPSSQLSNLQGFFDSANQTNQLHGCNLPLGSRGVTGISDGCPIWMVLGWFSGTDGTYVGMLEPGSEWIKQCWDQELHVPLTPALANQRTPAQLLPPIAQLLLQ